MKEKDIFWCTADVGWITGHSYIVYGPMFNGVTQIMYEGVPNYPHSGRFWELVEKYKATIYQDGKDAHWEKNPKAYSIKTIEVTAKTKLKLNLAAGGGTAISFFPL